MRSPRKAVTRQGRAELFGWVYENNQWGRSPSGERYYSDSPPELTEPVRRYISHFIRTRGIDRVVDLGCGDYVMASGIDLGGAHYVGIDIHDKLIEHNRARFGDRQHEFLVRDLVEDELPTGDLCLATMVLYLNSHADVHAILRKLRQYRYVIATDGQADIKPATRRNIDKPTDKYTPRDHHNNGFYLELPPFDLHVDVVSEYRIPSGEIIRTVLIDNGDERNR